MNLWKSIRFTIIARILHQLGYMSSHRSEEIKEGTTKVSKVGEKLFLEVKANKFQEEPVTSPANLYLWRKGDN